MGQCRGLGRRSGREWRRIPVDHRPKPAGPEWLGRVEGRPPGELAWGVRRESGVIPLGGLARIELGWPPRGCRYGGDPPAVGSGEAWLEEQAGGGGLGRGVRIQGVRLPGEGLGGGRKPAPYRGGGNPEGPQIRGRGWGEPLGVRVPHEGAGSWVGLGWGPGSSPAHTPRWAPMLMLWGKFAEARSGEAALGGQLQQFLSVDEEEEPQLSLRPRFLVLVKPPGVSLNH